ncbi:MAG: hypothetical protein ABL958_19130 [Bdellovibrionia bacterium]
MRGKWKYLLFFSVLGVFAIWICIAQYSFVFAKTVVGEIVAVEKVVENMAIIGGRPIDPAQMFSFAVAIRVKDGEIVTASSEDRQWSLAQKGQCAEARFYPYPPWDLDKAGTYHNARMTRLFDCPAK